MNTPKQQRILVVDDEVELSQIVSAALQSRGYSTRIVNDSTRTLEAVRTFRPHLILLDFVMPGHDGGDVAQTLRTVPDTRRIPIIFLTSLARETDTRHTPESREILLAKPVSIDELTTVIARTLEPERSTFSQRKDCAC